MGDQLLPTIFTIGFGINYDIGTLADCSTAMRWAPTSYMPAVAAISLPARAMTQGSQRLRDADYLGEELLRYIADVGDNFQIDSDYWQLNASTAPKYSADSC